MLVARGVDHIPLAQRHNKGWKYANCRLVYDLASFSERPMDRILLHQDHGELVC